MSLKLYFKDMDNLRKEIKKWLKENGKNYNWLAEKCSVKYNTVRNWMSQTPIPPAKESLIRILFKNSTTESLPQRPSANGISLITVPFSDNELKLVEQAAKLQGITVEQFIVNSVAKDIKGELNIPRIERPTNSIKSERIYGSRDAKDIG